MPVFRVEKNRDYTTMSNVHLRDNKLSLKAKGLLSQILSLPDDWNYSVNGLASINKESRDSIRTAINELEEHGYVVRNRIRTDDGKLGDMEYVVYEKPVKADTPTSDEPELDAPTLEEPTLEKPTLENPTQDKPTQEKPALENPTQLNTYLSSTDKQNKDIPSKDGMKAEPSERRSDSQQGAVSEKKIVYGEYRNVLLSDTDMVKLKERFPTDYESRIERHGVIGKEIPEPLSDHMPVGKA